MMRPAVQEIPQEPPYACVRLEPKGSSRVGATAQISERKACDLTPDQGGFRETHSVVNEDVAKIGGVRLTRSSEHDPPKIIDGIEGRTRG